MIRKKWKLRQPEFGKLFNISKDQVSSYETGRVQPKVSFLIDLQCVTGINLKDLWTKQLDYEKIVPKPDRPISDYTQSELPPDIMKEPLQSHIRQLQPLDALLKNLETRIEILEKKFGNEEEE